MKKSLAILMLGLMSLGAFAGNSNINSKNENKKAKTVLIIKWTVYCDGIWSGYVWANTEAEAYSYAVKKCNS